MDANDDEDRVGYTSQICPDDITAPGGRHLCMDQQRRLWTRAGSGTAVGRLSTSREHSRTRPRGARRRALGGSGDRPVARRSGKAAVKSRLRVVHENRDVHPVCDCELGEKTRDVRLDGGLAHEQTITVHDARRTCATLLVDLDVHPRIVMEILRHAQIEVTMEIYAQASSPATQEALRRLGEQLSSPTPERETGDDQESA